MSLRARLAGDEGGWVIVSAVVLMVIMLGLGMTTLTFTDSQQRQAQAERQKESPFNVGEAALSAQTFGVARGWPSPSSTGSGSVNPMPASCSFTVPGTAPADLRCPDPTRLAGGFNGVDFPAGTAITTYVRDNGVDGAGNDSTVFYDPAFTQSQPLYDANGDDRLWVRVDATVLGRTRRLVALVRLDRNVVPFARRAVLAGKIATTNSGKKVIFDTQGDAAEAVPIGVRCAPKTDPACVGVDSSKGQIAPDTLEVGASSAPALTTTSIQQLIAEADRAGTHYTGCPTFAQLTSQAPVVVDSGACSYTANAAANTHAVPGLLVIRNGTLSLGGNTTYHGIVYALNEQGSTGWVVQTSGTALIDGAVFVDGAGGVLAGSSKQNVVFNDKAFGRLKVSGDGSIVRNTWRELPSP